MPIRKKADGRRLPLADAFAVLQKCRMKTVLITAVLFASLICGSSVLASTKVRGFSGDRERLVSIAQSLERAALNPELANDRAWAIQWLVDAPDISISACLEPIGGVSRKTYVHADIIIVQYMIAMGAYIIRNPEKRNDAESQQLAGVESALTAYQSIRTAEPLAKSSALENLIGMQRRGDLHGFVREAHRRCLSHEAEKVAPTIDP